MNNATDHCMKASPDAKSEIAYESSALPLVSIGIPTYNGGDKVVSAVLSILRQGYPNLEIVISDNCSTDQTQEICERLCSRFSCVKYFRQCYNIGMMPNFRFVLGQATGELFMWMSDDDLLEPGILVECVSFLMKNPGYSLVSGQIKHWRGDDMLFCERNFNIESKSALIRMLSFYFKVVNGSIFYGLMPRRIAMQIPLINRIGDDWHFVASVAYLGKIRNLDVVGYHKKAGGISSTFDQYASAVRAPSFSKRFPHLRIAFDAFINILLDSPVYSGQGYLTRMALACSSLLSVLTNYFLTQYPFIVGGKLMRALGLKTTGRRLYNA